MLQYTCFWLRELGVTMDISDDRSKEEPLQVDPVLGEESFDHEIIQQLTSNRNAKQNKSVLKGLSKGAQNVYNWIVSMNFNEASVEDQERVFTQACSVGLKMFKRSSVGKLVENYYYFKQLFGAAYSVFNTEPVLHLNITSVLQDVRDRELIHNELGHKR
jgi:hypothetical protein